MPAQAPIRASICAVVVFTAAATLADGARLWTDSTGNYEISAELLSVQEKHVVLRRDDGQTVRVPIERLSDKDQAFLKARSAAERPVEQSDDETKASSDAADQPPARRRMSKPGDAAETGAEAMRSIKEAALAFYQGLREADRAAAREVLTATAQEMNSDAESPLGQLPTPDPGTRSILTGKVVISDGAAEIPVRVSTEGTFHSTKLHMRLEEGQWKVFAISARYPDGEKSLDFEAEPLPASQGGDPVESLVGQPMPLSGYTLAGRPLDMSQLAGKIVLVDFWATWCGPCREEIPNILENWKRYHDEGFEVVAISLDRDLDALRQFVVEARLPWTVVADKDPRNQNEMAARYGVRAIPTLVLIGRDGRIAAVNCRGDRLGQELDRLIDN